MTGAGWHAVPDEHRASTAAALVAAGADRARSVEPVAGGASGALTYRVDDGDRHLLLRIETARDLFRDPYRSYPCLLAAAAVGVAPAVHHADPDAGIVVMGLVEQRPLAEHPGGTEGLVRALGALTARLQTTPVFPPLLGGYDDLLAGMLDFVGAGDVFAPGVLRPVVDGFERLRSAYPWSDQPPVSTHNDLNETNIIFDGERLWLVDWELAFRNDPLADLATVANNFAATPDLVDVLLQAWRGTEPDIGVRSRLALMQQFDRLFYGCLILSQFMGHGRYQPDLSALSPDELRAAVTSGRLAIGSLDTMHALGMLHLAAFMTVLDRPELSDAETALRS